MGAEASNFYDNAVSSVRADLRQSKKKIKRELESTSKQAVRLIRGSVNLCIEGVVGKEDNPKTLDAKYRMQEILAEWRWDWQFPGPEKTHILLQDLAIPDQLRPDDVAAMRRELNGGDDSDEDSDEEGILFEQDQSVKSEESEEED